MNETDEIDIEKIVNSYIFDRDSNEDLTEITKKIINYCRKIELNLNSENLLSLLHIIDCFYKALGFAKIISNNQKYIICDIEFEKYVSELFTNKKVYKKIKEIKNANPTILLEKIYKNFFEGKNENVQKIYLEMNKLKGNVIKKLSEPNILENNLYIKEITGSNQKSIVISNENLILLQKKTKNANIRKYLEDILNNKTQKILNDFAILLLYRHKYANLLGHDSYFEYIKQKGSVNLIKSLINDLLLKIEQRTKREIERIHRELKKDGYDKKVDQCDFLHYSEKFKATYLFKPVDAIKIMFEISEKMFGISFRNANYRQKLWSDKILTCKVMGLAKEELGIVHFDLYKTQTKKINSPLCVKLSGYPKRICLLTSYDDINSKCMTYSDIVLLFKEFGCVLQMITHNKDELIVKNDEFDILMSHVMEYIVWEKDTIKKFCVGLDSNAIEHILFMRYVNFAVTLKSKCVNSLFDHIIHNSSELIDLIKENTINDVSSGVIIESLYKKIYADIWGTHSNIFNLDINNISPNVILSEISGNESTIYCNILTEILSFAVYTLIKNGNGKDFIKNVLSQPSSELRNCLDNFIGQLHKDSYFLYLQEVIGYNEIDTEIHMKTKEKISNTNAIITESGNYYDDNDDDDYEENTENIDDNDDIIVFKDK